MDFLYTDLEIGFTFAKLAETRLEIGHRELAEAAIDDAEKAYGTVRQFLRDPKHFSRLSTTEYGDLTAELQRLRERLDELKGR